jgi:hypothetical protein
VGDILEPLFGKLSKEDKNYAYSYVRSFYVLGNLEAEFVCTEIINEIWRLNIMKSEVLF